MNYTQTQNGGLNPHRRPDSIRSRRADRAAWVLLLALAALAVAVAVAASRPAHSLTCIPPAPCDAVGDPPPAMPMPPFGGCIPGAVVMCPRAALPVVTR